MAKVENLPILILVAVNVFTAFKFTFLNSKRIWNNRETCPVKLEFVKNIYCNMKMVFCPQVYYLETSVSIIITISGHGVHTYIE